MRFEVGIKWAFDFSLIFSVLWRFFFFEYCFSAGGILFFLFLFVGGVSCVYSFITLVSCFVYSGCAGSLGVFLAGRVIFSAWGFAVWGVGPVQFI